MKDELTIRRYMTHAPSTIGRGATIQEALREMRHHHVRHFPVMDGAKLTGLVSERELEILAALPSIDPSHASVELAMIPDPFHVDVDAPLKNVAADMAEARVGSAVVMSKGEPIGIFTTVDALRALADVLR